MGRAAAGRWALAVVLACALAGLAPCSGLGYDPCAATTAVVKGGGFVLGLVLVPAVNDTVWSNLTAKFSNGLCSPGAQQELVTKYNAAFAVYNLKVDRLHVLRLPYADIVLRMNMTPPTMLMAAFRANYTSPAVYIASGDDSITRGAGFVVSVALLARFDKGFLSYLQWYDQTCNDCGGKTSDICIASSKTNTYACATPLTNCSCYSEGTLNTSCIYTEPRFSVCATSVNAAWLGTDRNQAVFKTGSQVQRLNAYSIVDLFNTGRDAFNRVKNYTYTSVKQSWSEINSGIANQGPDFEGGLTQARTLQSPPPPRPPTPPGPPPSPPSPSPPTAG